MTTTDGAEDACMRDALQVPNPGTSTEPLANTVLAASLSSSTLNRPAPVRTKVPGSLAPIALPRATPKSPWSIWRRVAEASVGLRNTVRHGSHPRRRTPLAARIAPPIVLSNTPSLLTPLSSTRLPQFGTFPEATSFQLRPTPFARIASISRHCWASANASPRIFPAVNDAAIIAAFFAAFSTRPASPHAAPPLPAVWSALRASRRARNVAPISVRAGASSGGP